MLGAVLLATAVGLLADLGLRLAVRVGAEGPQRMVAAAPFAAAAAVLGALGVGLLGLGGEPFALLGAAVVCWLGGRRLPAPSTRLRVSLGWPAAAAFGAGLAWTVWIARNPGLGVDTLTYHLTESVLWVQDGHIGTVRDILDDFPVGSYPVTNEVLVAWALGLSGSLSPALLFTPLAALLYAASCFTGLRSLGARRWAAGLAPAAILLIPIAASQHIGPHTDLPALAWLATAAALVAFDRPALLVPAVLAGALAVGTKTTMAPLGVIVLAYGLWRHRSALPLRALAAATAVGIAVGGTWYLRNWVDHGWPLWPFSQGPGGDPLPSLLTLIDFSFLERPEFTLRDRTGIYFDVTGGALLVLCAGVLAWLLERRRLVAGLSLAAALAAFIWANAPFTGRADNPVIDFSVTTVRYLFGALTAAAAALALTRRTAAAVVLAVAAAISAYKSVQLPFPLTPSTWVVLAGAGLGVLTAPLLRRVPATGWLAVLAVFVAAAAPNLPQRHARASDISSVHVLRWFTALDDERPVAFAFQMLSVAAGDELQRELRFIPRDEPCERVLARLDESWVIGHPTSVLGSPDPMDCLSGVSPAYRDPEWVAYRPR